MVKRREGEWKGGKEQKGRDRKEEDRGWRETTFLS